MTTSRALDPRRETPKDGAGSSVSPAVFAGDGKGGGDGRVAMARMEATAAVVATASKGTRLWLAMGQNMDGALTNGVLGLIIKLDILRMTAVQLLLCAALATPATTSFGVEEEEEEEESAAAPSSITDRNVGRGAGNCFGGEDADGVDDALTPMPADVQGAQRGDVGQLHQSVGGRAVAELPQAKGLEMEEKCPVGDWPLLFS